ncbi:MAG: FliM/FliN family flagellar motor switch protein [Verrucomicrobiales bacterium]|jgi:type III secretion protein Q|nr:FliM/FliN family flagellar motor switch protein [bacterium]MDF2377642.1 FliM/FliN family flagellar motor switch protein [Verrucomicrobiales bacterium]
MTESSPAGSEKTDEEAAGRTSAQVVESVAAEINTIPIADLHVSLTFEVGSKMIPIGDLSKIQAGFCFEMERSVERPVVIRANGKAVGEGELIDLEGRVAVRISDLSL